MNAQIFNELLNRKPEQVNTITDEDIEYECYELSVFPLLSALTLQKAPTARFVSIELLSNPDTQERVFSILLFDDEEEIVGGAELTKSDVLWDEDLD